MRELDGRRNIQNDVFTEIKSSETCTHTADRAGKVRLLGLRIAAKLR